jgi:hypothetical protein
MTRYTTLFHQLIFIAAFIGPMVGSNLANAGISLMLVLMAGAGLRLLAGGIILSMDVVWPELRERLYRHL